MTVDENKALISRQFEVMERGDMEVWVDMWAPVASNHGRTVSREQLEILFESLRTAFPDRRFDIQDMIAAGDSVVTRVIVSGTFGQPPRLPVEHVDFITDPPIDRSYEVQAIHIWRVTDGKIAEHWAGRDDLGLLMQLGAISAPYG